ncbi:MAG: AAA family ATPase, partial [Acidimicrobiales bacterium]
VAGGPIDADPIATRGENPYLGLRAFDEADASRFHGRQRLTDELVDRLGSTGCRLLVLVGASGSGKSSVVRAGLLPALRAGRIEGSDEWYISTVVPGARPFESLEAALLRVAVNPPGELLTQLTDGPRGLDRAVQRIIPPGATLLLFIDQMEELYTQAEQEEADRFQVALTEALTDSSCSLRAVVAIRGDFYHRPLLHQTLAPLVKAGTCAVTPLAPDELEAALVEPARQSGVEFERGLVSKLVVEAGRQPGSLPLLEVAVTNAFDLGEGPLITAADLEAVGGLNGSLVLQAETIHNQLGSAGRRGLRLLLGQLVTVDEGEEVTRRRAHRSELDEIPEVDDLLRRLGDARLITFDHEPRTREATVELAHEALIGAWPRLQAWIDEDRDALRLGRHLAAAASDWDRAGRPESDLYRGGRLDAARCWREERTTPLSGLSAEYLDASAEREVAERDAEARRYEAEVRSNRRLRRLLSGMAVLLAMALLAGGIALDQRRRANRTAFDTETARLVATTQILSGDKPREALLVALVAYEREQSAETVGALQTSLVAARSLLGYLGWGRDYVDVEWLSNGLVVGVRSTGLDLYDPTTSRLLDSVELPVGRGLDDETFGRHRSVAASDESVVAVATEVPSVLLFDVDRKLQRRVEVPSTRPVTSVMVKPDGSAVAYVDDTNTITVVDDEGSAHHVQRLETSSNLLEQAAPILGPDPAFKTLLQSVPVLSLFHRDPDDLVLSVGAFVRRFDWQGVEIAEPLFLTGGSGGDQPHPEMAMAVVPGEDAGGDHLVAKGQIRTPPTADVRGSDVPVVELEPVPALAGGGLRNIVDARRGSTDIVYLLSDGSVVTIDPADLSSRTELDLELPRATSVAVNPTNPDQLALASPQGLVVASLAGEGPITTAVPRVGGAPNLTIHRDGELVVTGGAGASAPTTAWVRAGDRWDPYDLGRPDDDVFAAVVPDVDERQVAIRDAGDENALALELTADGALMVEREVGPPVGLFAVAARRGIEVVATPARVYVRNRSDLERVMELGHPDRQSQNPAEVTGLRFDPTGERLLVADQLGSFDVWDVDTWERIDVEVAYADIAIGYWNHDGSLLATASSDGRITIRDGQTLQVQRTMTGPAGTSNSWSGQGGLHFSPDDRYLLTNIDGTARLWDVASGLQVGAPIETATGTNSSISVGAQLQLVTGTEDHALIWDLDIDSWVGAVCRVADGGLTEADWQQWGPRDEPYRELCAD